MFNPAFTKSPSLRCAWRWGEVVRGPDQGDQRVVFQPGGQHEPVAVDPRPQAEIPTKPRRRLGDPADLVVFIDVPLDQLQLAEPGGLRLSGADRHAHDLQVDGEVRRKSCQEPLRDLFEQQVQPGVRNAIRYQRPAEGSPYVTVPDRTLSQQSSAAVAQLRTRRGPTLILSAMSSRSRSEKSRRSVRLGRHCRNRRLVFSLLPRCHGLDGSQK